MEQTTDYNMFQSIVSNREVDLRHVNKLVQAIKKKNLLHLNPIICNDKFEVIDGQHRLEAAKILVVPIYFIIDALISKNDIADINSNAKNWNIVDFINYWTIEKRSGFDKLSSFLSDNPLIQPTTAMLLLSADFSRDTNGLKNGNVDVSNYTNAVEISKILKYFRNHIEFAYDRNFVLAIATIVNYKDYDHEIMKSKVEMQPRSLVRCINKKQYMEMLAEIYNYKSSKKRIDFKF